MVTFHAWIRPEMKFPSVDALIAEMGRDVEAARSLLAGAGPGSPVDQALAGGDQAIRLS